MSEIRRSVDKYWGGAALAELCQCPNLEETQPNSLRKFIISRWSHKLKPQTHSFSGIWQEVCPLVEKEKGKKKERSFGSTLSPFRRSGIHGRHFTSYLMGGFGQLSFLMPCQMSWPVWRTKPPLHKKLAKCHLVRHQSTCYWDDFITKLKKEPSNYLH